MKNLSRAIILLATGFLSLFPLKSVLAEHLLIVEVQLAGDISSNDFIRIYNPTSNDLNVSGYRLRKRASTGRESSIRVFPRGSLIKAKGYFLWANSKENFHLTIRANAWSATTLARNNSIALLNPENVILDALAWGKSQSPFVEGLPFPENPKPNQRLERKKIGGIYQDTNNNAQDFYLNPLPESLLPETEAPPTKEKTEPTQETQPETQPEIEKLRPKPLTYPSGIIINEILPSPEGPDETEEWIEMFNQNNFEVDLSGWKIQDTAGRPTTYVFPEGRKISPRGFLVLHRPTTKITLNNDNEGLNLVQPDGKMIDSVSYEKAPRGQSYNRTPAGWVWSATLTPGLKNIILDQEKERTREKTKDMPVGVKPPQIIDINTASLKELQKIVGIGPVLAQRIIDARPFYSLDELTRVRDIGSKTLADIKNQGLAWVDPELERPKTEKEIAFSEKGLAAVATPFKQGDLDGEIPRTLSIFLIAITVAIFSGTIILVLKKKLKAIAVK